jgi:uncharacterized delta-60 repeat protein
MKTKINDIGLTRVLAFLALLFFGAPTITAAPGDLDSTFGQSGRVFTIAVPGFTYFHPNTESMLVQPDGKILVCGRFWEDGISYSYGTIMVRYMPDGTLDTSFGENGRVAVIGSNPNGNPAVGADMTLQPDGKIVLIGNYSIADGIIVQRYTSSGMLDTTFGNNGTTVVPRSQPFPAGASIAMQPDGKIVGVGWEYYSWWDLTNYYDAIVVFRINANGSMDNSFGSAGTGVAKIVDGYDGAEVLVQPDGKIVVVGMLLNFRDIRATILIARYNSDGSLDSSFGTGGKVTHRKNDQDSFSRGAALQPDGKIVVTGGYYSGSEIDPIMVRYNPNGSLDTGFGTNGIVSMESGFFDANTILVQAEGKIVATGNAYDGTSGHNGFAIVRLISNGSLDPSFGAGGRSVFTINAGGTNYAYASDGALQPDGKILVTGYFGHYYTDSHETIALIRVDGSQRSCPNPIDCNEFFVRQHYQDFLNREPDAPGLAHWAGEITACDDPSRRQPGESLALCIERKRADTSAAFFLSPEFQYTGYFVYRLYKGSLIKNGAGRIPTHQEFLRDVRRVAIGIIQNNQLSALTIEANKKAFAEEFTQRAEFRSLYDPLSNFDYVERLFQTTGINVSAQEKQMLVDGLNNQTETRASALQKVVDGTVVISEGNQQFTTAYGHAFYEKEFNSAFVLMEYFGYLQRDPDAAGYQHWLDKLNFYGNYIDAEMVRSFTNSPEYRARFSQP